MTSPENFNTYLGDGAYVELDSYEPNSVVLYTSNGMSITNTVILGPYEVDALINWFKKLKGVQVL